MLQKWLIKMECINEGFVRGYGGTELHGWLFHKMGSYNPQLSSKLHDNKGEKPFVIGPINGAKKGQGKTFLEGNKEYTFSIASLNQEINQALNALLSEVEGTVIKLNNATLRINGISKGDGLSYYDILEREDALQDNITFQFNSPTSFRQQGTQELFPQPELVFRSLLRKWNTFSPVRLPDELVKANLLVKRYNLQTELVDFGKYKIIGCTGRCTYQLDKQMPAFQRKMLHSLAHFAEFAGVGYKTSMGLGDVRYISHDRR